MALRFRFGTAVVALLIGLVLRSKNDLPTESLKAYPLRITSTNHQGKTYLLHAVFYSGTLALKFGVVGHVDATPMADTLLVTPVKFRE